MPIQKSLQSSLPRLLSNGGPNYLSSDGFSYLDLSAQTLNLPYGQPIKQIINPVIEIIERGDVFYSSRFGSDSFEVLGEKLIELSPDNMQRINHKLSNGTDAVETALKLSYQNQRSKNTFILKDAWHGESFATLPMYHKNRSSFLEYGSENITFSDSNQIESLIELAESHKRPSTVILDPVGFSGGLFDPKEIKSNLESLKDVCSDNGHILIFDEIQCFGGFLGSGLFSFDVFETQCDIITVGKALGQGFPIAACLYNSSLSELLYNEAEFTYGGQPPACMAAISGLSYTIENSTEINKSYKRWKILTDYLNEIFNSFQVRQIGFFCVIDFQDTEISSNVFNALMKEGLITRRTLGGRAIALKGPLSFTEEDLSKSLSVFEICAKIDFQKKVNTKDTQVIEKVNTNERYVNAVLSKFSDLKMESRSLEEQVKISDDLHSIGVPVALLKKNKGDVVYAYLDGVSLDKYIAKDESEARQIFSLLIDWLKVSHKHKIVIGDRWSGNTIWDGVKLSFIDFDIGYMGSNARSSCFEHFFAIFHHANIIPPDVDLEKFLIPYFCEFFEIWKKEGAVGVANQFCDFYGNPRKAKNDTSLTLNEYLPLIRAIRAASKISTN